MEVKRKFLPPSKNHGDLHFRLVITLRLSVSECPTGVPPLVSAPFKVFSKQSEERDRPPPKRVRNAPPTKPLVAVLSSEDLSALCALSSSVSPTDDMVAPTTTTTTTIAQPRAKRLCVAVLKRTRDEDDASSSSGTISEHDVEEVIHDTSSSSSSSDDEDEMIEDIPPAPKRVCGSTYMDVFSSSTIVRPVEIASLSTWGVPVLDAAGTALLSHRRQRLLSVSSNCSELNLAPPIPRASKDDSFGSLFDSEPSSSIPNFPDLSCLV